MQIYVKDDVGVIDLQILTVQVTDVNEPPQFPGNLAKGKIHSPDGGIREEPGDRAKQKSK